MSGKRPFKESGQFLVSKFGLLVSEREQGEAVIDLGNCSRRFAS
jgi:hypothetical protein